MPLSGPDLELHRAKSCLAHVACAHARQKVAHHRLSAEVFLDDLREGLARLFPRNVAQS